MAQRIRITKRLNSPQPFARTQLSNQRLRSIQTRPRNIFPRGLCALQPFTKRKKNPTIPPSVFMAPAAFAFAAAFFVLKNFCNSSLADLGLGAIYTYKRNERRNIIPALLPRRGPCSPLFLSAFPPRGLFFFPTNLRPSFFSRARRRLIIQPAHVYGITQSAPRVPGDIFCRVFASRAEVCGELVMYYNTVLTHPRYCPLRMM